MFVPLFSHARALLLSGIVYGGVLYVIAYQILGRLVFKWFEPVRRDGSRPRVHATHLGFGLLLVTFFLTTVHRYGKAPAAHAAADRIAERRSAMPTSG